MMKLNFILTLLGSAMLTSGTTINAADTMTQSNPIKLQRDQTQEISKEDIQKISEAFGHFIGRNLNTPGVNFDVDSVIKGIRDGVAGKPAPMSDKDYEEKMMLLQKVAFSKLAEHNLKAANEFMAKNKNAKINEGGKEMKVMEIVPDQLQYIILEQGTGPAVEENGSPLINYTGKYIDGSVFSSSADVGGPITIPLNQTIPGFSKGIKGMKEGEKRRLFVHPDQGYGTMGQLPPNSLLIFDIEVVKAVSPKQDSEEDDLMPLSLEDDEMDDDEDDEEDQKHGHPHAKPAPAQPKK